MNQHFQTQQISGSTQPPASSSSQAANSSMISLIVLLPLLFVLGVIAHKRHRAAVLRQQVQTLEKLWRLNFKKTTY